MFTVVAAAVGGGFVAQYGTPCDALAERWWDDDMEEVFVGAFGDDIDGLLTRFRVERELARATRAQGTLSCLVSFVTGRSYDDAGLDATDLYMETTPWR